MRRRSSIPVIVMLLFTLLCSIVNAQGLSDSQWVQVQSEVEALNLDYFRELALWQSVSNTLAAALADVSNPVIPQGIIGDTVPAVLEEGYSVTTAGQVASNLIIASQYGRDDDVELFVTHLIKQKQSATIVIQVSAVLGNTGKTTQDPDQLSDVVTSLSGFLTQMGDLDYSQQTLEDTLSVMEIVASLGDATNMLQVIEYLQDFLGQMGGSSVVRGTIQALYEASLRCNTADEVHRLIAQITGLVVDGAELGISDTGLENLLSALSSAIGQSVSAAEVEGLLSRLQALFQDAADMGMSGQEMTRTTSVLSNIVRNGESLSQINAALDTLSDVIGAGGDIDAVADLVLPVPEPPEKDTAPTEAEKLLAAARLAKGKGQYAEAVSLYQQAFDLEQSLLEVNRAAVGEVYFEWAIQLAATGEDVNLQLALEKLDLAIDIHPAGESGYVVNKAAVYLALGNLKMAAENWADAVDYFALAVELDQRTEYDAAHGSAYYQWALELVDLGTLESLQQALTKLDLAISANPTGQIEYIASKADVYLALGALYLDGAFYEQAIGAYTDAITLVDSEENKTARGQVYAAWAEALFLTEDYLGAIDKYKLATLDYPAGSALYDEKQALCYYMLAQGAEETDDVISYLTSAHELDPSYAADLGFAYAERAAEHLGLSEYEAAYDDMNIALGLIPEQEQNSELWYLMAATANGVEDYSTAVEYWLRWLNAPDVQVDVYYYYSVFLYCVGVAQDLDTALMVAEQAVLLFPGGFSYQILACANLVNGNIEEGLFTYLDGLKLVLASEDYTDEDIHYYISNYFDIAAYAFLIHPDLGLEEELLAQIGSVFYDAVSASIEEVVSTYDVIEGDFFSELAVVGITEEQVRTVFDTCIDHLLGQDLNAANIIPLLRETQFQLYDELLALATGDFAATAEAVNQAIFETLWVGEASLGGRLQTIMDTAVTTLRGISDRNEVLGSAVAVNLLWDCADYVGYDLDMEQAVLLIGATRHIISVRDEIRKMPRAIEIALAEFKERAEALQLGGIATAFDEVLAANDWKFDVDRRDWDWNSLEENEQAFLETFLKDPVGILLVIQRAMEEHDDVNDSAAAAMALWHSVGTEILPEAIGQIPDFTVEEWNTAATALMEAFMSLVTRTPIEDLWPSDEQKARNLVNQAIAARLAGEYDTAMNYYNEAFDLWPALLEENRQAVGETYADWALQLAVAGDEASLQSALEKLDLAIDIHPDGEAGYVANKAAVYFALGNLEMAAENWADAVNYFAMAVQSDQKTEYNQAHGLAYYQWALELVELGTLESLQQALTKLDLAIYVNPTGEIEYIASKADVYLALGALYLDGAFYEQAIGAYTDAITLVDSEENKTARGQAYAAWAEALFTSEDYQGAIEKYQLAALDYPAGSALYNEKQALCYYMLAQGAEEIDNVISYLTSAHGLDASYAVDLGWAYVRRAEMEVSSTEWALAEADLEQALGLLSDSDQTARMHSMMGVVRYNLGKFEEAIASLDKAIHWPGAVLEEADLHLIIRICLEETQDFDSALEYAEQLVTEFPTVDNYRVLATTKVLVGDVEAAIFVLGDGLSCAFGSGYTEAQIQSYVADCFMTLSDALIAYPDLNLTEQLVDEVYTALNTGLNSTISEVKTTYHELEPDLFARLSEVGITEEDARGVFNRCIEQLCSQQLNAANVIPLLRETQFTLYEELAALATSDGFPETAEAINTFVFETLWVGETSLGGRLQTIMNTTSAALKTISDRGQNVGYATANSILIEASNQVRTFDVEQAALLIGAARHLIGVKEEIKRMPEVVGIAMVDFRARAEALNMTTVAAAFDETLAGLDWRFDVDRRDWSWNALDGNEQVFLETLLQDPLGTLLTIQRSLEERDDVNQVAAEARQLWESLSTEILPSAIGYVADYEIPDWNRASEALMTAFMSLVTGTPISSK